MNDSKQLTLARRPFPTQLTFSVAALIKPTVPELTGTHEVSDMKHRGAREDVPTVTAAGAACFPANVSLALANR